MQRAAEEGSRDVEDTNVKIVLCCKSQVKPNRGRINDGRGDVIVVDRLLEIAAADKSNFPFANCPIGQYLTPHNPKASNHTSTF